MSHFSRPPFSPRNSFWIRNVWVPRLKCVPILSPAWVQNRPSQPAPAPRPAGFCRTPGYSAFRITGNPLPAKLMALPGGAKNKVRRRTFTVRGNGSGALAAPMRDGKPLPPRIRHCLQLQGLVFQQHPKSGSPRHQSRLASVNTADGQLAVRCHPPGGKSALV